MTICTRLVKAFAIVIAVAGTMLCGRPVAQPSTDPAVAVLGEAFHAGMAQVNGTTLHYVRGGTGPGVILVHGFPQDWYEFHKIMPPLARQFTVTAVDLRGIGRSQSTAGGYDAANLAEDIHQLVQQLQPEPVYIVGHDIGGMVAYAFARLYPQDTRGVMILDVPLPGIEPWQAVATDPMLWHISFHQTPELPEQLISGRQAVYFRYFFTLGTVDGSAISAADAAHYVSAYAAPEQLRAGLEMYRALPANAAFNAAQRSAIAVPLVLAGGEKSFGPLLPDLAGALSGYGWSDVRVEIIANGGHYLADEQPQAVIALIERYAAPDRR